MFNQDEINEMVQLTKKLQPLQEKAEAFCNELARHTGWTGAEDVQIKEDNCVCFTAYWHGPYQAENHKTYIIPTKLFLMSGAEAAKMM